MKNHILCSIIGLMFLLLSCATQHDNFFRGDVIGFSDKPTTSYRADRGLFMNLKPQSPPYNLLEGNETSKIRTDIKTVPRGNNTTAYYAMELAAKRVNYIRRKIAKRDPLTKYYIFLLTDGLDNASSQVAKNEKRILFNRTPKQYQKRVHRQLKNAMGWFSKNTFEVYPMMYEGEDLLETKERNKLTDAQFKEMLKQDMECFRYSSEGKEKAPELISADNFQSIITELRSHFEKNS
ncbi:MAG: hypothetical protein J5606_00815 [Bacteroidales bacterium]|nr:hypothetical protein [Bacteroidales bacterium]